MTVRSDLPLNASDGIFYSFNTTRHKPIYLTMSLCHGPSIPAYNASNSTLLNELDMNSEEARTATLVAMYVSTNPEMQRPGPDSDLPQSQIAHAQGGWTSITLPEGTEHGIWIGVWPPVRARGSRGTFRLQLAASTKRKLEDLETNQGALFDDSDRHSALITSFNYTSPAPNISLIVLPTEGKTSLLSNTYYNSSLCRIFDVWEDMLRIGNQPHINSSETSRHTVNVLTRGYKLRHPDATMEDPDIDDTAGVAPIVDYLAQPVLVPRARNTTEPKNQSSPQVRKQFYIDNLQASTNYTAYLVSSKNASGIVSRTLYPAIKFVTKKTRNCKLMYDLSFCPEVAYAVPFNPSQSTAEALKVIESFVSANYGNFSATLNTFPCDSDKFGMYSSVSTCADCRRAYQSWLCAVAIPRCTDQVDPVQSAASQNGTELEGLPMPTNKHLLPYIVNRGVNQSRQSYIDEYLKPGPYGELLPCLLTCEMVTRSCPPVIGWACPRWTVTAQRDYGTFADADSNGLSTGENGGAGPDGQRFGGAPSRYVAYDAFGHVFCNSMDVDRLLRQASGAWAVAPSALSVAVSLLAVVWLGGLGSVA